MTTSNALGRRWANALVALLISMPLLAGCDRAGDSNESPAQPPLSAQEVESSLPPIRPFILSQDLDSSLAFYRDLLQFDVLLVADYDSPRMRHFIDMPTTSIPKVAILSDNGVDLAFSIVSVEGVSVDSESNRINAPKLVLNRSDVLGLHQAALAGGYEVLFPPEDSLDANNQLYARELGLIDPDGLRILVLEKFKVNKP